MLSQDLKEKLIEVNSSRKKRVEIALWVSKKPLYIKEMLLWCFIPKGELLVQTAWVLEIICELNAEKFIIHKQLFIEQLPLIKNDSALRSCAKICEMLCENHFVKADGITTNLLTKKQKQCITECCFDWLITDQKVACQAPAMEALYFLGKDEMGAWIYPELKNILIKDSPNKSAGYQARARKILKLIC